MRPRWCFLFVLVVATCIWAQTDPFTGLPSNAGQPTPPSPSANMRIAHTANEEPKLVFKSQSVLVEVPAVVTDASGKHVHGLTKADFKVLENGKPQPISICNEVTTTNGRLDDLAKSPDTFSNYFLSGQEQHAVTVILLDMVNTPFLDQAYARRQLMKYLGNKLDAGHGFALAVLRRSGVQILSGLDNDPATVIAALKKVGGEVSSMESYGTEGKVLAAAGSVSQLTGGTSMAMSQSDPGIKMQQFIVTADAAEGRYQEERNIEDTMRAFLTIAMSLTGIPGRKSLIWVTGSFPFVLDSPQTVPGGRLTLLYEKTLEALNDTQISVYPVDARGLVDTSPVANGSTAAGYGGMDLGSYANATSELQNSMVQSLRTFAAMTGGRAYANSNDLETSFRRAADDASNYYEIGYYVNSHDRNPGWRKLQVQVDRKGVEIHARTGYLITNTITDPEQTHKADLEFALTAPFDSTGIPITLQLQGTEPNGDKKKVTFAVRLEVDRVIDAGDNNRFDLDFVARATKDGTPSGSTGQSIKGTIPADALPKLKAEGIFYNNALELPRGNYQIRVVVRDNLTGKVGSVSAPMTVP